MIGILAHSAKSDARSVLTAFVTALEKKSADFVMEEETAAIIGRESKLDDRSVAKKSNVLAVLGGDGTILRVIHRLGPDLRPIFGINIGSLGFLTCVGPQETERAVESLMSKDYILSSRALMRVELSGPGGNRRFFALNDIVVGRGQHSELVKVQVSIDGKELTEYNADGLIVSTPTGSTAYSLSAGGPILMPDSGGFVITPICPHVLTNRSLVLSDKSVVEASMCSRGKEVILTVDGQKSIPMSIGHRLTIRKSSRKLKLAMLPERLFPEVLRQKLKWSGSNI